MLLKSHRPLFPSGRWPRTAAKSRPDWLMGYGNHGFGGQPRAMMLCPVRDKAFRRPQYDKAFSAVINLDQKLHKSRRWKSTHSRNGLGSRLNHSAHQRASDATGNGSSVSALSRSVSSDRVGRAPFHAGRPDKRVLPRPFPRPRFPRNRSVPAALIAAKIVPDFVQRGRVADGAADRGREYLADVPPLAIFDADRIRLVAALQPRLPPDVILVAKLLDMLLHGVKHARGFPCRERGHEALRCVSPQHDKHLP